MQYVSTQIVFATPLSDKRSLISGYVLDEPQHIAGIAILVVVPGNDLDEGAIQRNTGFSIEDRRVTATTEVGGYDFLVGIRQGVTDTGCF